MLPQHILDAGHVSAQRPLSLFLVRNPRLRKAKPGVHRADRGSQDLNAAIDHEHGVPATWLGESIGLDSGVVQFTAYVGVYLVPGMSAPNPGLLTKRENGVLT